MLGLNELSAQHGGLNPETGFGGNIFLHWHTPRECRIPYTAIPADLSKQSAATVLVTHYFDAKRQCRDCGRALIFFAEEQKYWYEELGFVLESDCVRCVVCRKQQQGLEQKRERYEELFYISERCLEQNLEFVDCALSLVEASVFTMRQLQRMRTVLKKLPSEIDAGAQPELSALWMRLLAIESENHG